MCSSQDLGLMVIDEEQRLAWRTRNGLKEIRKERGRAFASATPIPRTLHMSLWDCAIMSIIETRLRDRLAIQTVVAPFQEELIANRSRPSCSAMGVYFIHNRVGPSIRWRAW